MCNQYKKCLKFHAYAYGGRPSRAIFYHFVVDDRYFSILGKIDPVPGYSRPIGYPDSPDDEIADALVAVVKGWA